MTTPDSALIVELIAELRSSAERSVLQNARNDQLAFQVESLRAELEDARRDMKDMSKAHDHTYNGNGTPGIKTRVDRLEQRAEAAKWWTRALGSAAIGSAVTAIAALVQTGRHGG